MTENIVLPETQTINARLTERWVDPQRLNIAEDVFGYGSSPRCPNCPAEYCGYLHAQLNRMVVWPDDDAYDSPAGTRGEFILIPLSCEICGKQSALTIANHKGTFTLTMLKEAPSRYRQPADEEKT